MKFNFLFAAFILVACQSQPVEELLDTEFRVVPTSGCSNPHTGPLSSTVTVNGVSRPFRVEAPTTWDGTTPLSVLYSFHACGGNYLDTGWNNLNSVSGQSQWLAPGLDTYNVLVVSGDSLGTCWDVSPSGPDLPYYDAVREAVEEHYCINEERRYHAGVSSGGFAAQGFACRRDGVAGVFSGLGGIHHPNPAPYGLTPVPVPTPEECNGPVPIMSIASTTDTLVSTTTYTHPARDAWLDINECDPNSGTPYVHRVPRGDTVAGVPNGTACTTLNDCACLEYDCEGARTVWCEFAGTGTNGHQWPGYYRDSAVNWVGLFTDVEDPEPSTSSSSGNPTSSTSEDSSSSTAACEMVCQCI